MGARLEVTPSATQARAWLRERRIRLYTALPGELEPGILAAFVNRYRRPTLGSDMNEMPHLRLATSVAFQPILQIPILARRALMLAKVLGPGAHQERFEVDIWVFEVPENPPA